VSQRPRPLARPVAVAAGAALLVAALGGLATSTGAWYDALATPPWKPPDWLFGPAWTMIFALAAISGVTAWRAAPDRGARACSSSGSIGRTGHSTNASPCGYRLW